MFVFCTFCFFCVLVFLLHSRNELKTHLFLRLEAASLAEVPVQVPAVRSSYLGFFLSFFLKIFF